MSDSDTMPASGGGKVIIVVNDGQIEQVIRDIATSSVEIVVEDHDWARDRTKDWVEGGTMLNLGGQKVLKYTL